MKRPAIECEAKFVVRDEASLRRAPKVIRRCGVRLGPARRLHVRDVYLDTDDHWLLRAGVGLRARFDGTRAMLTLKTLRADDERLVRRMEWEETHAARTIRLPGPLPRGDIARWLRQARGPSILFSLVELDHEREEYDATDESGAVFKLSLDRVRVANAAPDAEVFREVEIELQGGTPSALKKLIRRIERQTGWRPSRTSKLERGLRATGIEPPPPPAAARYTPTPDMPLIEAAWRVLGACFAEFERAEPGARAGLDPESLHDMRVAARRMRAALQVYGSAWPPDFVRRTRIRLKALFRVMGRVRDLDVGAARLRQWAPRHPRVPCTAWAARLDARRDAAWQQMLRHLKTSAFQRWMAELHGQLDGPPPTSELPEEAYERVGAAAPEILRRRFKRARRAARNLDARAPDAAFHELRIRVKKLRYTIEFFAGLHPKAARRLDKRLRRMQDELGAFQDDAALRALVQEPATDDEPIPPREPLERLIEKHMRMSRRAILKSCGCFTARETHRLIEHLTDLT